MIMRCPIPLAQIGSSAATSGPRNHDRRVRLHELETALAEADVAAPVVPSRLADTVEKQDVAVAEYARQLACWRDLGGQPATS